MAVAFVAVLVAVLVAPAGIGPRAQQASAAHLPTVGAVVSPGVFVGPVDLSGMDETAARAALSQAFAYLGQGRIDVQTGDATSPITYAEISRQLDIDGLLQEALAIGRTGPAVNRIYQILSVMSAGVTLAPRVIFNADQLTTAIATAAAAGAQPATNARAVPTKTGFTTKPSELGVRYDPDPIMADLTAMLNAADSPATITISLPSAPLAPVINNAQARAAADAATLMSPAVVLANAGDTWTIPAATVHSWIGFSVVDGSLEPTVDRDKVVAAVKPLAAKINRSPVSASWKYGPTSVVVTPDKDGRKLDPERTADKVVALLKARADGTASATKKTGIGVTLVAAKVTTEQAQATASKLKLLGTWTTVFQPAAHNGFGANIWIPAKAIDGTIVKPGEKFSFWKAVGPVTLAKGYKLGGAIIDGRTQEGVAIGGGICSTSTTLFNAALRAGYKMGARQNHYYYISRYPVGLDANVLIRGGSVQDMTWTNDSPDPILIKAFNGPTSVTFSLFGVPNGRTVSLSKPVISGYTNAYTRRVPTSALPAGRARQVEFPDDGFNARVTRTVRDKAGQVVHKETYYSHYATITGLVYVGDPSAKYIPIPANAP